LGAPRSYRAANFVKYAMYCKIERCVANLRVLKRVNSYILYEVGGVVGLVQVQEEYRLLYFVM